MRRPPSPIVDSRASSLDLTHAHILAAKKHEDTYLRPRATAGRAVQRRIIMQSSVYALWHGLPSNTCLGRRPTAAAMGSPFPSRNTKCGMPCTLYSLASSAHLLFSMLSITKLTLQQHGTGTRSRCEGRICTCLGERARARQSQCMRACMSVSVCVCMWLYVRARVCVRLCSHLSPYCFCTSYSIGTSSLHTSHLQKHNPTGQYVSCA